MAWIDEYRKINPWAEDYSDADVIAYKAEKMGMDPADFASAVGYQINKPGLVSAAKNAVGAQLEGAGQLLHDTGLWENNPVQRYGKDVMFRNPMDVHSLSDIMERPGDALAQGTGMALGYLGPGLAGRGLQLAGGLAKSANLVRAGNVANSAPVQTVAAAIPSYGGIRGQQIADGNDTTEDKLIAGLTALGVGGVETRFGAQRMLGIGRGADVGAPLTRQAVVDSFGKTALGTAVKAGGRVVGQEMGEELVQNPMEQLAAYQDPTTLENIDQTLTGSALAGLGTLGFGGIGGARAGLQHAKINQYRQQDLLNTDADISRISDQAQWERAFQNKAGQDGAAWFDQHMNDANQQRMANTTTWGEPVDAFAQRLTTEGNLYQGEGLTPDDVNANLGVGRKAPKQHFAAAYNALLDTPVIVEDADGKQRTLTKVGELYDYQNGLLEPLPPPKQPKTRAHPSLTGPLPGQEVVPDAVDQAPSAFAQAMQNAAMAQSVGPVRPLGEPTVVPAAGRQAKTAKQAPTAAPAQGVTQVAPTQTTTPSADTTRLGQFQATHGVKRKDSRITKFLGELDIAVTAGQITPEERTDYEQKLAVAWKTKETAGSKNAVAAHNALVKAYADELGARAQTAGKAAPVARNTAEVPDTEAPAKPSSVEGLADYKQAMQAWLTSKLAPEEVQALITVRGIAKESLGDEDAAGSSLRAAAKGMGVSHQTVANRANAAEQKIRAAAAKAGIPMSAAEELLDLPTVTDVLDVATTGYEGKQRALTTDFAGSANDDFDAMAGMERSETGDTETGGVVEEEGDAGENVDGVSEGDIAEGINLAGEKDINGNPIRPVDVEDALADWAELEDQPLHPSLVLQWTKLWIAHEEGAINDARFKEQYLSLAEESENRASQSAQGGEADSKPSSGVAQIKSYVAGRGEDTELGGRSGTVQAPVKGPDSEAGSEVGRVFEGNESRREKQPLPNEAAGRGGSQAQAEGVAPKAAPANPLEARVAALRGKLGEKQSKALDKLIARYQSGDIKLERLNEELDNFDAQVEDGVQYSKTPGVKNPTSESAIRKVVEAITGRAFHNKIVVFPTAQDAVQVGALESRQAAGTQAWVHGGKAYFIADAIPEGAELAVFLHEVGAHLGLDNLLGPQLYDNLLSKIEEWEARNDGSLESRITKAAARRLAAAGITEDSEEVHSERLAYFIEEAVKAGVDPTANNYKTELGRWFRQLWAAFKTALAKLGVKPDALTAQDVVNLAYGAARLELVESQEAVETSDAPVKFSKLPASLAEAQGKIDELTTDPKRFFKNLRLGFTTLEQIFETTKSVAVKSYRDAMVAMQSTSKKIVAEAAEIDREWAALEKNQGVVDQLNSLMTESTRIQFDPSKDTPATPEQRALTTQWNALGKGSKAQQQYERVRDFYQARLKERQQIMENMAKKAKLQGKELEKFKQMYAQVKGPYFPLVRIGDYYAVGMSRQVADLMAKKEAGTLSSAEEKELARLRKDSKHYTTSSYARESQAKKAAETLKADYAVTKYNVVEARLGAKDLSLPGLPQLEAYINAELPAGVRTQVKELMAKMAFEMAPEGSALKRMLKREGVSGYDTDMRKVFATTALSQAHYISRLKHNADVSAGLVALSAEGRANPEMRHVYNELAARAKLANEMTSHPIVDRLLNVSYFAHLGVSPAFVLTNMTQVPMVTLPWLGARHGFGRTGTALARAYSEVFSIVKTSYRKEGWRTELDWKHQFAAGSGEDKLFSELLERNLLDITMEHDLGVVAEMGGTSKLGDWAKMANTPVRMTEYANRAITALAAYRLARDNSMSHEAAVEHAAKAVSQTQMDYSGINTARHMQSVLGSKALAKMMFQFRKYQQGMLWLLTHNMAKAVKSADPEERRHARNYLLATIGMTGTFAGTLGLPFIGTMGFVANMIAAAFGDADDPWDWEEELRNTYAEWFGDEVGRALSKGVLASVGIDMSKRIGLGDVASPLPFTRAGNNGRETVGNVLAGLGGASMGTVADTYDGIVALASWDFSKAVQKAFPLKLAKDIAKATTLASEGMVDSRGNTILAADQFSPWDVALRGSGLSTVKESEYWDANEKVQGAKKAADDVRTKLLREVAMARIEGEDTADIMEKIAAFNERHPEKGVRIDHSSIFKRIQQERKMARERNEAGVRTDKRTQPFLDRGAFAYE